MNNTLLAIEEQFLDSYLKENPVLGSSLGIEACDGFLPEETRAARDRQLHLLRKTRSDLLLASRENRSFDEEIDAHALLQFLEEQIYEDEELPYSSSFPAAPETLSSALYTVFTRDYEPLEERLEKLGDYLDKTPLFLESSRERLLSPVALWVHQAIPVCDTLPVFIDSIVEGAGRSSLPDRKFRALKKTAARAKNAVNAYKTWLSGDLLASSREDFALGHEKFDELLRLRRLGYNREELLELGAYYLDRARQTLKTIAGRLDPSFSWQEIREKIRADCPHTFDETLEICREAISRSRDYVISSGFATIPGNESLVVRETPAMFQHFAPLAAYIPPGKFQKAQQGVYLVTRTDDHEVMKDFNRAALFNRSIHEGYPGHHLQFVCANTHHSPARILCKGLEFLEGWAHYCEDFVVHHAFPDNLPLLFTMNLDLIWKACRVVIDVKLCCGDMTIQEAIRMLTEEAGFTGASARAEVLFYIYTPCYQLSYLTGKHLLQELRTELLAHYGSAFSDRKFHDLLLYSGNLPMNHMKKIAHEAFREKAPPMQGQERSG